MSALTHSEISQVFIAAQNTLEKVIFHRIGCRETARDLSQDMFFKLDRLDGRFHCPDDVRKFLTRIAVNAATDHYRVEKRRTEILANTVVDEPVAGPGLEGALITTGEMQRIEAALQDLPAKCRDVLYMSRIQGMTHAEIATQLGVSRSLVEKYAVKALLHCRACLAEA